MTWRSDRTRVQDQSWRNFLTKEEEKELAGIDKEWAALKKELEAIRAKFGPVRIRRDNMRMRASQREYRGLGKKD